MDNLSSLHNAIRSAFHTVGAEADWSKDKTKTLFKALNPEQQKLVRELAQQAANSSQRVDRLEAVVSELSSSLERICSNDSAQLAAKDAEINELRDQLAQLSGQVKSLAKGSGIAEETKATPPPLPRKAVIVASRHDIVSATHGAKIEAATREVVMIREFVQSVKADSTLLETLRGALQTGKALTDADKSIVKKTVVANVENWLIEKKRPSSVPVDEWKKLVRDSIADPENNGLFKFNLPNLHHFIEMQIMTVRDLLSKR